MAWSKGSGVLSGRTAIVSGGARGIGAAHVRALIAEGANVVIGDVLTEDAARLASEFGDQARAVHLDVTDDAAWARAVAEAETLPHGSGHVDILINNAGVSRPGTLESLSTEDWDLTIAVNLSGTFKGIRAVAPSMRAAGGGAIVNTTSMTATVPVTTLGAYVATKLGVLGLTRVAAMELADAGIRVNALHPGFIDTAMTAGAEEAVLTGNLPIPRFGRPDEVAAMMIVLVAHAPYTTGSEFGVDGGAVAGVRFA